MIAIGNWVKRRQGQKYHAVESVVAGDAITRCGRRLADPFAAVSATTPLTRMIGQPQLCRMCDELPGRP